MAMTTFLSQSIAQHTMGIANYTQPTSVFLALFTADPTSAGLQTSELSNVDYVRLPLAGNISVSGNMIANINLISFNTATIAWTPITHIAICDAATGGNILYFGPLTSPRSVAVGEVFAILSSDLTITLS